MGIILENKVSPNFKLAKYAIKKLPKNEYYYYYTDDFYVLITFFVLVNMASNPAIISSGAAQFKPKQVMLI